MHKRTEEATLRILKRPYTVEPLENNKLAIVGTEDSMILHFNDYQRLQKLALQQELGKDYLRLTQD